MLCRLVGVDSVAVASDGTVYIADRGNDRIRKVATDGMITMVAGTGTPGSGGGTAARRRKPVSTG